MQKLGIILALSGLVIGAGYLCYWFFMTAFQVIPLPLKIAIVVAVLGLLLLLISVARERHLASKDDKFKGVDK